MLSLMALWHTVAGHDYELELRPGSLALHCVTCHHRSSGWHWTIKGWRFYRFIERLRRG